jgi:hypothetical protein
MRGFYVVTADASHGLLSSAVRVPHTVFKHPAALVIIIIIIYYNWVCAQWQ